MTVNASTSSVKEDKALKKDQANVKLTKEDKGYADQFHRDGFVCLRSRIPSGTDSSDHLQEWQTFAQDYFQKCFSILHEKGHTDFPTHCQQQQQQPKEGSNNDKDENTTTTDTSKKKTTKFALGLGVKHGYREIVMRSPGRYELSLLECQDSPSIQTIKEKLTPILPNLLDASDWSDITQCHLSLVVSTPGCPDQSWHADGGHVSTSQHLPCHVANVFVPLHDVPIELGPTEFRPGSHVFTRNLAPMMLAARARKQLRPPVTPTLKLGDVLVFDYRVLHRGRANLLASQQNRYILVLTFSKPWYKDVCNFPTRSMFDPPARLTTSPKEETDTS